MRSTLVPAALVGAALVLALGPGRGCGSTSQPPAASARQTGPQATPPDSASPGASAPSNTADAPLASASSGAASASGEPRPPPVCSPLLEPTEAPTDPSDLLFYVNRWRSIPPGYPLRSLSPWTPCNGPLPGRSHPEVDLVCLPRSASYLTPEALRQVAWDDQAPPGRSQTHDGLPVGHQGRVGVRALLEAARQQGHDLRVRSGYRSYPSQGAVFRSWVRQAQGRGLSPDEALRRASASSAQPGHSEHQLGTTVDLVYREPGGTIYDGWDPERIAASAPMRWVAANAHRFGLVLSYEREATHITQYVWEPWHYRYVGVEAADELRRCRMPLEAFLNARYRAGPQPPYELP